jgi:hypothetical protein
MVVEGGLEEAYYVDERTKFTQLEYMPCRPNGRLGLEAWFEGDGAIISRILQARARYSILHEPR